jgi:hypothetical protein
MKTKSIVAAKAKKQLNLTSKKRVVIVHAKHPVLRHFRLIEHKHTGKLIHFRYTSHVALAMVLVFLGFFLFISDNMVRAEGDNKSIFIGAIVPGPAPTIGATITSPDSGLNIVDQTIINVVGTCAKGTFVVVGDNNQTIGSASCTEDGKFDLQVQILSGKNTLSALNYDNLNQSGPVTPSIIINVSMTEKLVIAPEVVAPVLPSNPSIIPGVDTNFSDCSDYKTGELPTGGEPRVAIVCIPRLLLPNIQQTMGILMWGGSPPYAGSIKWGDNSNSKETLLSVSTPGYKIIQFSYAVPNTYRISVKLTDKDSKMAIVQTSVQVNGEAKSPIVALTNDILGTPWFRTPVPFYLIAVAITLGFWGGDIFDRKWGASGFRPKKRQRSA